MIYHVNSCSPICVFARGLPLLFSAAGLQYEKKCMTWLFLGIGSAGCVNRLEHSLYGVFCFVCTPPLCLRNGMLDIQLLPPSPSPKKEMVKETSALKPQILQNDFLTTSCLFVRCSREWLWVFRLSSLKHPSSPALLSGIWRSRSWAQPGKAASLALQVYEVSLLKPLDLVKERKSLHLFWQLLVTVHALFIIITLLMVFTKWQSQVLWVAVQ